MYAIKYIVLTGPFFLQGGEAHFRKDSIDKKKTEDAWRDLPNSVNAEEGRKCGKKKTDLSTGNVTKCERTNGYYNWKRVGHL